MCLWFLNYLNVHYLKLNLYRNKVTFLWFNPKYIIRWWRCLKFPVQGEAFVLKFCSIGGVNCCWSSPAQQILVSGRLGTHDAVFVLSKTFTCYEMRPPTTGRVWLLLVTPLFWGCFQSALSHQLTSSSLIHTKTHTHTSVHFSTYRQTDILFISCLMFIYEEWVNIISNHSPIVWLEHHKGSSLPSKGVPL
jgi:hypothetical protein